MYCDEYGNYNRTSKIVLILYAEKFTMITHMYEADSQNVIKKLNIALINFKKL